MVDKPTGLSSFAVVARVRRIVTENTGQKIKVGHSGTLDPMATGLMVILIGNYCKRATEFIKLDKTYKAKLTLGFVSSTGDAEGEIKPQNNTQPSLEQVEEVLKEFIGTIAQKPPAYSAVKVGGQRAYKLAREGKLVVLEPRNVTIYSLKLVRYRYPSLWLIVKVSSGTYIRSLAEDIGEGLGCGAYVSALRRLKISKFYVKNATPLEDLSYRLIQRNLKA